MLICSKIFHNVFYTYQLQHIILKYPRHIEIEYIGNKTNLDGTTPSDD